MRKTNPGLNGPGHVTKGSVFEDLGLSPKEVAEAKVKAELWRDLIEHVRPLGLTQKDLAKRLGVHQPDVSNLMTGKLSKFSVDALIGYAITLGLGVETKITGPKPQSGTVKSVHADGSRPKRAHGSRTLTGAA